MSGNRAGKEPAEDVMRRMVSACKEAGLVVHRRRTSLQHRDDGDFRIIHVFASPPGGPFTAIHIATTVEVDGRWSGRVGIMSSTQESPLSPECKLLDKDDAIMAGRTIPVVRGSSWEEHPGVVLSDLAAELMDVVRERKLVQDALAKGEQGPWKFSKATWVKGPIN